MNREELMNTWAAFQKNVAQVSEATEEVSKIFKTGGISHVEFASRFNLKPEEVILHYISDDLWDRLPVCSDGGLELTAERIHYILCILIPGYAEFDSLGKEGVVLFKDMELNKSLGFPFKVRGDLNKMLN